MHTYRAETSAQDVGNIYLHSKYELPWWKPQWCEKILRCATLWMKDFKKGYDSHNVFSWTRWKFAPFPSYNSYSFSLICFPSRPYLWRMEGSGPCMWIWKVLNPYGFKRVHHWRYRHHSCFHWESKGIRIWKERLEKWKPQWCEKILRCATLWMKDFKKGYDSHNVFSWSRWNFAPFPSYNSYSFSLICFPSRPYLWRMDPQLKDGNRAYHRIIWLLEECQASPLYSLSPLPPV